MEYPDRIYESMAEVLSSCYRSIDWSKAGQKSAYDYFAARVRSAGHERTVPAALDRLAKRCNVASFDMEPEAVAFLVSREREVLRRLRTESVYVALLAAKLAKEKKQLKGNASLEKFA
jgi:prophage DNA circulation protein